MNLLILCAGLKLQGREVIVGYSGHQMLCLASANTDAIAAGTWLNVRSFSVDKFNERNPDDISRRAKWYYCPQALSEYKIPFLDMGFNRGILPKLAPEKEYSSNYADILFSGAQPSSTAYSEQQSFRHYLTCLYSQCKAATHDSFDEAVEHQRNLLDNAEEIIQTAHSCSVLGQQRDFGDIIDVNRAALESFAHSRSFVLKRSWK